ncbi:hypothetical protein Tco_0450226 [Tanacetum coccineum]
MNTTAFSKILIMSINEQTPLNQPTYAVQNTLGKEHIPQDSGRPVSDANMREYCDKNYHQLLPIIAEKVHQEKVQQEKLKAVKARLNFEEASQHSESRTPSRKRDLKKRLGSRRIRNMSGSPEPRRDRSESPRKRDPKRKTMFKRLEKGVFHRLGDKGKSVSTNSKGVGHTTVAAETLKAVTRVLAQEKQNLLLKNIITKENPHEGWKRCQKVKVAHEDIRSQNQRGKSRVLRMNSPNHGEYDLWSMRMEQYLTFTDHALWEVIVNGDSVSPIASASSGAEGPIAPKTTEQKLARKNELKAKSTLMLAIPDQHLLKFHACKDANSLWEAIKNRFGGNKESKKMQKTILKQNYENFAASSQEGLGKTYDRFQKLISQLEIHGEVISQEDANLKLLRSLPSPWNNIALIMRNKSDLDTLSVTSENFQIFE